MLSDGKDTGAAKSSYLDDNTFIVGTECGSIYKFNLAQPSDSDVSQYLNTKMRWKPDAIKIMANL